MSARRPGISAGQSAVSWAGKRSGQRMTVPAPVATCALPPAPAIVRIAHPVIPQTLSRGWQVLRRYRDADGIGHELIAEGYDVLGSMQFCDREAGAAIVRDLNCKAVYANGQSVEVR